MCIYIYIYEDLNSEDKSITDKSNRQGNIQKIIACKIKIMVGVVRKRLCRRASKTLIAGHPACQSNE